MHHARNILSSVYSALFVWVMVMVFLTVKVRLFLALSVDLRHSSGNRGPHWSPYRRRVNIFSSRSLKSQLSVILNLFETATSTSSRVSSGLRRPARSRWRCVSSLGLLCPLAASQTDVLDSTGTALPRWIRPPPPPRRRQAVQWVFSLSI